MFQMAPYTLVPYKPSCNKENATGTICCNQKICGINLQKNPHAASCLFDLVSRFLSCLLCVKIQAFDFVPLVNPAHYLKGDSSSG